MGFKGRPQDAGRGVEATTVFLNVDLDLEGPANLAPLVRALGPVDILHQSDAAPFVAHLEIDQVGLDCLATISALLDLVEGLAPDARALWDQCTTRSFNIGIQSGLAPHYSEYALPATLLSRLAAVGADAVVTIYGARQ